MPRYHGAYAKHPGAQAATTCADTTAANSSAQLFIARWQGVALTAATKLFPNAPLRRVRRCAAMQPVWALPMRCIWRLARASNSS